MTQPWVLGIVLAGGAGTRLSPLTADRAKPAVPFGGLYRLIDFALSNLANGGILQIGVLTQYKSHSLDRHISTTWRMSSLLGNYVTPVPAQQRLGPHWYTGSADAIHQSMNLINDEQPDIVIVFGADHVYRMDPRQMIDHHVAHGAGVTVAAIPVPRHEASAFGIISVGGRPDGGRVPGEARRPAAHAGQPGHVLRVDGQLRVRHQRAGGRAAQGRRRRLEPPRHGRQHHPDAGRERQRAGVRLRGQQGPRRDPEDAGYWRDVGTLDSYFDAHMDLCAVEPVFNLYNDRWPILTHVPSAAARQVRARRGRPGRTRDQQPGQQRRHRLRRAGQPVRALARGAGEQLVDGRAVGAAAQHRRSAATR